MQQHIEISLFGVILLALASMGGQRAGSFQATLVLKNAKVWTVDERQPQAQAIAIWRNRLIAVGSDSEIESLIGETTQVVDLRGRLVLPGFIDNHTHFLEGGKWLAGVKLKDAKNEEEFGERLASKSRELPPGAWITGGTWDHDNWPGGRLPTAELIDRFVPERPVFVSRYDGHMSVANSRALKLAGITAKTPDPPGGVIVRKPGSREPTGVLKDAAQALVERVIPEPDDEEIKQYLRAAMSEANRVGVTSIQDMNLSPRMLRIYQEMLDAGEMGVRVDGRWPLAKWRELADLGIRQNFRHSDWLKIGGLKGFVDGSLGSSTALFFEPYAQDSSTCGIFITDPEQLRRDILAADSAGLHLAVHAIGDRANSFLLDVYAEAIQKNGPRDRRFRIEHAQHIHPKDFARFAKLGVIACAQPYHAIDDGRWAEKRIGTERCKTTYPFRSFLDHGVRLCFGSDWTVAPLDPLTGIYAAVTRRTPDGKNPGGWFPEQKIRVEEAIAAYTIEAAYAAFDDDRKGSVTPGKLADLVVLSRDILTMPPEEIIKTHVVMTILDGRIVYSRE